MVSQKVHFSYSKGTELHKGNKARKGVGFANTKIKELAKPKWRMSDTGTVRTKITFPRSNKATVGRSVSPIGKTGSVKTSTGRTKNALI